MKVERNKLVRTAFICTIIIIIIIDVYSHFMSIEHTLILAWSRSFKNSTVSGGSADWNIIQL